MIIMTGKLGVAEAKRRFSELIDRVQRGERVVVFRRGRPAMTLVAPDVSREPPEEPPLGLAAFAGALADWPEIAEDTQKIIRSRRRAGHRQAPQLE